MSRKVSLTRIEAQIRALEAKAQLIRDTKKRGIEQLKAVLEKYQLDMTDIKKALNGKPARTSVKAKRKKNAPKYRNPANKKETWTGMGRKPQWFAAAIQSGSTPESLAI